MPNNWACYNLSVLILNILAERTSGVVKTELENFFVSWWAMVLYCEVYLT